jgi:uncharacterized protein
MTRGLSAHELEFRCARTDPPELRKSMTGRSIGGKAIVFGAKSSNLGGFIEVVEPQALRKSAADGYPGVICRYQHDDNYLLGTTDSGTLQLSLDDSPNGGLDYTVDVPECREDVLEMVRRKDVKHSSWAFQCYDQEFERGSGDGPPIRHLLQVRLVDVSPVTTPAYVQADVGLRSLARQFDIDPEEIFQLDRDRELRKLWDLTGGPKMPAREALKQVGIEAKQEARTKNGRQALLETMAAAPIDPRVRLSETMAARSVPGSERLAQTLAVEDPVEGQLAALKAELAEQRAELARLSDPNLIELEDAREQIAKAEELAQLDLRQMSGQPLSGRDALKLMGVAPSTTQPEARSDDARSDFADPGWQKDGQPRYPLDTPERVTLAWDYINDAHDGSLYTAEQLAEIKAKIKDAAKRFDIELDDNLDNNRSYRRWVPTMNPHEALRQLEAMRLPEPPRPAFRACDAYAAESGGRF